MLSRGKWVALRDLLALFTLIFLILPYTAWGGKNESRFVHEEQSINPHLEFACTECHEKSSGDKTRSIRGVSDKLNKGIVELCRECHPESEVNHHPVKVKAKRSVPAIFPLDSSGLISCSSCHNVHMKSPGNILLRGFDKNIYVGRMDFCLDCHGKGFSDLNPHRVRKKKKKCHTCHDVVPGAETGSTEVSFREELSNICNFCHNVKEKSHPLNVDPLRKLPASLPRDVQGRVNCGTCHDPHGGDTAIHFLRQGYVEFLESGRYANPHGLSDYRSCEGCHLEVRVEKSLMKENLRYGGNTLQICLSCHGAMESCHPVLIKPAPDMAPPKEMPLSTDGRITCLTCHYPMPPPGTRVELRGRNSGDPINAICMNCHFSLNLFQNPHASMSDRKTCRFCHDTVSGAAEAKEIRVSFISNTRLICLRCHPRDRDSHPVGNHMVTPGRDLPGVFHLDFRGKITCTTCHNPHITASGEEEGEKRHLFVVNVSVSNLCVMCHK